MEIERKCEFNTITPEEINTYKFATSIRDKKAIEKFIEGPLNLGTVQRTIEIDKYNRKYGDKNKKKDTDDSEEETVAFTRREPRNKKNWERHNKKSCYYCGRENWTPKHKCPASKAKCKTCDKYGHIAKVCKTKPVQGIDKYQSESEEWPEVDHISIGQISNQTNFYKTTLLVDGQPIEFVVDTGSPITLIPPIIGLNNLTPINEQYVDVNKNPIKFSGARNR